jgi:hypothetical protein
MPPLNEGHINALPLEIKQRICSFLTPKELKPLRLTARIFATAAERYLIDRFILFNCPDSIAALDEIIDHEVFSKHLTTLVCDTATLTLSPGNQSYGSICPPPSWDDYRPKTLALNDTESYGSLTKRVMQCAHDRYQTACNDWEARKKDRQVRRDRYEALRDQQSDAHILKTVATVRKAVERCPRLRNLVLSGRHSFVTRKRRLDILGIEVRDFNGISGWSRFIVRTLKDLSQLSSLTLIYTNVQGQCELQTGLTLPNLKHLRISHSFNSHCSPNQLKNCALILRGAKSLETLNLSLPAHRVTNMVKSLRSDCLRVCLLSFYGVAEDALVSFLLHHAASLQRLGLGDGFVDTDWSSVFSSIARRLPALQRAQFENLERGPFGRMARGSAQKAERYVACGGPVPVLKYCHGKNHYSESGRGTYTHGPKQDDPLPGIWPDYERIANERWDG